MTDDKSIVISFGRFNPPTVGHEALVQFIAKTATKLSADALVFPSQSQDPKKNPLPFREKVRFLRQLFGRSMNFSDDTAIRTPIDALATLSAMGYDNVYIVAGSDRVADFAKLKAYIKPSGKRGGRFIILKGYRVIPVPGDRDPDADGIEGMSASKMRALAVSGNFSAFRTGVPGNNDAVAKQLYTAVRRHMGIRESFARPQNTQPKAFMLYGVTPAAARPLREALSGWKHTYDITGKSYSEIRALHEGLERQGYAVTLYVRTPKMMPMTESFLMRASTLGMIRQGLTRDLVEVAYANDADAVRGVRQHARKLMESVGSCASCGDSKGTKTYEYRGEAWVWCPECIKMMRSNGAVTGALKVINEAEAPKPKQPTEVDRLKLQQKQQLLLTKERQGRELLAAKQRELAKKSREDSEKIVNGAKPKATTR